MMTVGAIGRVFFGIALAAFGVLQWIHGNFVTRTVPDWPGWLPPRPFWAWVTGAMLIGAGAAIVLNRQTRQSAVVLGLLLLASFVFLAVPRAAADSMWGGQWTSAGKLLALSGGALLVARTSRGRRASSDGDAPAFCFVGPSFYGSFLVLAGIQHFIHDVFVATLVPSWIPGSMFWTYFAGVALIAGGIGVVTAMARLAGLLSGAMIFAWLIVLHIPRALDAATRSTNETTAVFEALAMSGIGALVAAAAAGRDRLRHSDGSLPKLRATAEGPAA